MNDADADHPAAALVREGWNHLKRRRPIAARASWLRALRIDPDHAAARQAILKLEAADNLPRVALVDQRLRSPGTEARRKRWDAAFRSRNVADLDPAKEVFARLAEEDPEDADAWFNHGLGLAWTGRNVDAVDAIERSVRLDAAERPALAVDAWTLAELLRQGGGAEEIADDLTYLLKMKGPHVADVGFRRSILAKPEVRRVEGADLGPVEVYAWLDRPWTDEVRRVSEVPRILAHLTLRPDMLMLSSPDAVGMEPLKDEVELRCGATFQAEASPLSLAFLDAAAWSVMIPPELPIEEHQRLRRGVLEHYFEDLWITRPRRGTDGLTPLEASRRAATDPVLRCKLLGLVAYRGQIVDRPAALLTGQGYHLDRLRRRLGLPLAEPEAQAFETEDVSCMSEAELDALDPEGMNDSRLSDACESVLPLTNDARTVRFGSALVARGPKALAFVDRRELFAALIRAAIRDEGTSAALARLDQAEEADRLNAGGDARIFATWRAEVLARADDVEEAVLVYRELCESDPDDPQIPLDAAETLADRGFDAAAESFAALALDRAEAIGDAYALARARRLLGEDDLS